MIEISYKVNGVEHHATINRPVSDYGFELIDKNIWVVTNEHIDHDFRHLPHCPDYNTIVYSGDGDPYERIGSDGLRVEMKRAVRAIRLAYGMWQRTPIEIAA